MGSKLSTGALGTSKIWRFTCKCSAMMLIFGSLPKLGSAASASEPSGENFPNRPAMANAGSLSSDMSFDTQWDKLHPMSPLERRVNKHFNDILDEVAPSRAASPKQRKPRKSARSSTADAPSRSSAPTPPRKKTPIPETKPTDDVVDSPTVEPMELRKQYSLNSVPDGLSPPAVEVLETPKSAAVGPKQINYARFSFFKRWIKEFEAKNGPDFHITDADLKAKVEALIAEDPEFESTIQNIKTKEDWDATGAGTESQQLGFYRFPDYEDAIRRVLEFRRRKKDQALRKAAKAKREAAKAERARQKQSKTKSSGGFSFGNEDGGFNFDNDDINWRCGGF